MAQLEHIEAIEKRLWNAADTLRANSSYASNEYFLPVMGLIFLRYAYSRFLAVRDSIEAGLPKRGGKTREITKEDFSKRSAIYLRREAQFDYLVSLPDSEDRVKAVIEAMESIEKDYETLKDMLPKSEYQELDNKVLGQLLRALDPEELKKVSGDVFGRIYEYFLTQFADEKAHDGGEFFTPVSLVSLIANVLEPKKGIVLDPACGSGGMFVQSAHFVEQQNQNPVDRLTFYGLEKNATTIRLAKMNLAVHGLEGNIHKAITYYEDPHELLGKASFVMANPPFNVDEIDAETVKTDPRLPFGLPGVNKKKKVTNGNYVWISYFYSYLNEKGRAGFVMSSQASSAGRDEAKVRQKLIETGDVDIMISIRSNFFYTRSVPCELWFIDRDKPDQPSSPALLPEGEGGQYLDKPDQPSSPALLPEGEGGQYRGGYDFSGLAERARELRKKQTPAEKVLWEMLRDRQLLGFKFRRQHQVGDYILDFYCHEAKLAVELDGAVHEHRVAKDAKRDAYLKSLGIEVLRISNDTLLSKTASALDQIASYLPSPPGRGAGGEGQDVTHSHNDNIAFPPSPPGRGAGGEGQDVTHSHNDNIAFPPSPPGRGAGSEGQDVAPRHKGNILMVDARNIYRKVTRKIYDFSPEQEKNILAIVWLYRGQVDKYLNLVSDYCQQVLNSAQSCISADEENDEMKLPLPMFTLSIMAALKAILPFSKTLQQEGPFFDTIKEFQKAFSELTEDTNSFQNEVYEQRVHWCGQKNTNGELKKAVDRLEPLAETSRDLVKLADLTYKLLCRLIENLEKECDEDNSHLWPRREIAQARRNADEARLLAVEHLKQVRYFWKQAHWLTNRFPEAKLRDVEGLVKLVDRAELEENDWSLTPGRYVGVAPEEEDENFDFEETMREIHVELEDLNTEAIKLAATIKKNFEELGI